MILSLIVAMAKNRVIGKNNTLPWHLPEDLKRFRKITFGKPVIMGRKTLESIGRLLPGRQNIVITRDRSYHAPFAGSEALVVCHSLDEALARFSNHDGEVFILGGGEIFTQAIPRAQKIYLTLIDTSVEGDAFFPEVDYSKFKITFEESHSASAAGGLSFRFIDYERI